MRKHFGTAAVAAVMTICANALVLAQDVKEKEIKLGSAETRNLIALAAQPQQSTKTPEAAMQVQVVISRYVNDKRVSSLPYTLSMMSSQGRANLRLGSEMPMATTAFTPGADAKEPANTLTSFTMRAVGTTIDVQVLQATSVAEGRYVLNVTVSENWFQPADSVASGAKSLQPIARNYQSQNTVQMKDGETAQFTAATDRTTAEVIRVEVTLKILK